MRRMIGLMAGVALDALLGDPRRAHPVAAFGRAAGALERCVYKDSKARGAVFAVLCTGGVVALPRGGVVGTTAVTWAALGGASLAREGLVMADHLEAGDLEQARERLPHLCGRDPGGLDEKELARATVESIAENTSDAVIAPLFWGAVAGVPGLVAYRAINTLDAMVGHRSDRYRNFGWAAARLDDVANWVPARLTGLLAAVCAPVCGGSVRQALRIMGRDGARHPSPNAGRPEAAFAGALGVRLGGTNTYHGAAEARPSLGDGAPPSPADIRRAVRLSRATTVAMCAAVAALEATRATRR